MESQPYSNYIWQLHNSLLASPMQAQVSTHVAANTHSVVQTYIEGISRLTRLTNKAQILTQQRLAANPNYTLGRGVGVRLAWGYEKLDLQLGGSGSEKWMSAYKDEILHTGKVGGAEGHHTQNVANHPFEQANPDNIKFYQNREEHLMKGHGGDFHNESDMPMIDRQKMVRQTKTKKIVKNEVAGLGMAAIVGFGMTVSISLVMELAKNGVSYDSVREASKLALQNGAIGAGIGIVSYSTYRLADIATDFALKKASVHLSKQAMKGVKGGVAGGFLIAGTSVYGYLQLRKEGYSVQDSLIKTSKQAVLQTTTLALSLLPPPFGPIFAVGSFVGFMGYSILAGYWDSKENEEILHLQLQLLFVKASIYAQKR